MLRQRVCNENSFTLCDAQSAKQQRSLEGLVRARLGEGPEQHLSELARSSTHIPAAHVQARRACKHVGLIWHAFSHFRQILQVLPQSSIPVFAYVDPSTQLVHKGTFALENVSSGVAQEAGC